MWLTSALFQMEETILKLFEKQSGMAESKYIPAENTSFKGLNFHLGQQLLDKVKDHSD